MPAAGYTPILLYGSATAGATPAAANLTNGSGGSEIAINITDGRLYYKDNNGAVQLIGAKLNSVLAAALASAPVGTGNVVLSSALGSYAALAGSNTQAFNVANATTAAQAVPLGQAQANFAALAGSSTQVFSVANATAATQAPALQQIIGEGASGNAAYANVTASRALDTAYTNSTSRPLVVCVEVNTANTTKTDAAATILLGLSNGSAVSGAYSSASVAGNTFPPDGGGNYSYAGSVTFVVPPGGIYMAHVNPIILSNTSTSFYWFEY